MIPNGSLSIVTSSISLPIFSESPIDFTNIFRTSIAASEAGRITQSVVAFEVLTKHTNTLLTFIDTPGHETFHAMRKRGEKNRGNWFSIAAND